MLRAAFLCGALALVVALHSQSGFSLGNLLVVEHNAARASDDDNYEVTCEKIAKSMSSASQVFYPSKCRCNSTVVYPN